MQKFELRAQPGSRASARTGPESASGRGWEGGRQRGEREREREIISASPRHAAYAVLKISLHNAQFTPHSRAHLGHGRRRTVVDMSRRLLNGFGRWGFRKIRCGVAGLHRERSHIV